MPGNMPYGNTVTNERIYQKEFARFKKGDLSLEDKLRTGRLNRIADEKLVSLYNQIPHNEPCKWLIF